MGTVKCNCKIRLKKKRCGSNPNPEGLFDDGMPRGV